MLGSPTQRKEKGGSSCIWLKERERKCLIYSYVSIIAYKNRLSPKNEGILRRTPDLLKYLRAAAFFFVLFKPWFSVAVEHHGLSLHFFFFVVQPANCFNLIVSSRRCP